MVFFFFFFGCSAYSSLPWSKFAYKWNSEKKKNFLSFISQVQNVIVVASIVFPSKFLIWKNCRVICGSEIVVLNTLYSVSFNSNMLLLWWYITARRLTLVQFTSFIWILPVALFLCRVPSTVSTIWLSLKPCDFGILRTSLNYLLLQRELLSELLVCDGSA